MFECNDVWVVFPDHSKYASRLCADHPTDAMLAQVRGWQRGTKRAGDVLGVPAAICRAADGRALPGAPPMVGDHGLASRPPDGARLGLGGRVRLRVPGVPVLFRTSGCVIRTGRACGRYAFLPAAVLDLALATEAGSVVATPSEGRGTLCPRKRKIAELLRSIEVGRLKLQTCPRKNCVAARHAHSDCQPRNLSSFRHEQR